MTARSDPAQGGVSDADMIRAITLGSPDVASMSEETRTYLSGRTVPGVRVDASSVDVHVIARYGTPLPELTAQLGVLLRPVVAGRTFHLHIEDIELPGDAEHSIDASVSAGTTVPDDTSNPVVSAR